MIIVDLEKYKSVWKNQNFKAEEKLSANKIAGYLKTSSKNTLLIFKKTLIFDIVLKVILLFSVLFLIFIYPHEVFNFNLSSLLIILIVFSLAWQSFILKKIPQKNQANTNLISVIKKYISFYYNYYFSSVMVGALTASLVFIIGFFSFLSFKYHKIPNLQIDDLVVILLGIIISYAINFYANLKYSKYIISQLEEVVDEIEENILEESVINKIDKKPKDLLTILIIALFTLFLILIFLFA